MEEPTFKTAKEREAYFAKQKVADYWLKVYPKKAAKPVKARG